MVLLALLGSIAPVYAQGTPPQPGEHIRVRLSGSAADRLRLPPSLEATFVMFQGPNVVADTPFSGALRLPLDDVESVEVERRRGMRSAIAIGSGAGAALGVGMWQFLAVLCGSGCDTGDASTWGPAIATALGVGIFVGARASSGRRWVRVELPR